jgi:hypothetical protein
MCICVVAIFVDLVGSSYVLRGDFVFSMFKISLTLWKAVEIVCTPYFNVIKQITNQKNTHHRTEFLWLYEKNYQIF